jgi:geranylgeranyl diphosphate synthase type II
MTEILGKTAGKDSAAEKATYPGFYGVEETKKLAENVYSQTVNALKAIEKDTRLLTDLASFVLKREK